jgi:hypothetical protein
MSECMGNFDLSAGSAHPNPNVSLLCLSCASCVN